MNTEEASWRMNSFFTCLIDAEAAVSKPINAVIIETPEIVYSRQGGIKQIIARAASLMDTSFVAAALWMHARFLHFDVRTIKPREWQSRRTKSRAFNSKQWSLLMANAVLKQHGQSEELKTKKEENIADAIVMGKLLIEPIFSGEIQFH